MIDVEICTPSRLSAVAAKEGGAKRIELCSNLEVGGLTPTDEDIVYCVQTLGLRTHVLVRPRAGNFLYTADEMAEIERTVMRCRQLGAAAVVVGFLTPDGKVDLGLTRRIVQLAAPMEVTFHRAFDEALQDPIEALQAVMEAGCHRLLTSGQAPTAPQGAAVIKRLVDRGNTVHVHPLHFAVFIGDDGKVARRIGELGEQPLKHVGCPDLLGTAAGIRQDAVVLEYEIEHVSGLGSQRVLV